MSLSITRRSSTLSSAWAASQLISSSKTKKPVYPDGKTEITIHNYNDHVADDTLSPTVLYFVHEGIRESLLTRAAPHIQTQSFSRLRRLRAGNLVYEASESIERRKVEPNETLTILSSTMLVAITEIRFDNVSS